MQKIAVWPFAGTVNSRGVSGGSATVPFWFKVVSLRVIADALGFATAKPTKRSKARSLYTGMVAAVTTFEDNTLAAVDKVPPAGTETASAFLS
jgi:hypothetical protein